MFRTVKTYLRELTGFRNLRFECIRSAESLEKDVAVLQREYDDFSSRQSKFEDDYSRILTNRIPLVIGVAGNFNAGKSSFINSLIGADLLGVKEVPATCKVAVISYHDNPLPRFYKVYKDGRMMETDREEYLRFGLHNKDTSGTTTADPISHFEIKYRAEILKEIQLVDTPGFSTLSKADDNTAEFYLKKTDMLIWVFSAHKGSHDNEEFDRLRTMGNKKILAVINRMDDVFHGDRQPIINTIAKAHGFLRVIPYSATVAFDYQRSLRENEEAFKEVLKKAEELRSAGREYIMGSKGGLYFITDSADIHYEVKISTVLADEFADYHLELVTEIRRLRQEMSDIKEDAFRQELMTFHQQETDYWDKFGKEVLKRISHLLEEQNDFDTLIRKLNKKLMERSGVYCERLKTNVTEEVFGALCYFEQDTGNWFTDDKNYLKMRDLDDPLREKIWDIINDQFESFKADLVKDFHKGLKGADVEVPPGPEMDMIDLLLSRFRQSSFDSIVGVSSMYVPFDFVASREEMKSSSLTNLDCVIASDHFAGMTLYCLQTIYDRLLADMNTTVEEGRTILSGLSEKITAALKK